jgi:hypothetical protein
MVKSCNCGVSERERVHQSNVTRRNVRSFDSKLKPDIVLINESTKYIIVGELTCPMEARMTYWHEKKD